MHVIFNLLKLLLFVLQLKNVHCKLPKIKTMSQNQATQDNTHSRQRILNRSSFVCNCYFILCRMLVSFFVLIQISVSQPRVHRLLRIPDDSPENPPKFLSYVKGPLEPEKLGNTGPNSSGCS